MNKLFYAKLAATNIGKNRKTYIPYMLTCIITVAMFYIIKSLSMNEGISSLRGGATIESMLYLGCWIVAIFAVIFLFYTNSFLIKRRKKEFGLFNILGMEKKPLSRVIGIETLYIAVIGLVLGLGMGILLDKAMYLQILKILGGEITLGFYISWESMWQTFLLFGAIFILIFLNSLRQVHLAKPIELLRGGSVGEKEPKANWFIAIVGAICLGLGYYIAVVTQDPIAALAYFFSAAILVIIGTYLLFTAGSITLLKLLRKNKRYYYKTNHFISISGMLYRMKQNAVGLANICILSTAVLVMISSTTSLMIGSEDMIRTRYPYDIAIYSQDTDEAHNLEMMEKTRRVLEENHAELERVVYYNYLSFVSIRDGNSFITDKETVDSSVESIANLFFIPLEDYNRVSGEERVLQDGQILLYANRQPYDGWTLEVFGKNYTVKEHLDSFAGDGPMEADVLSTYFIVVKDMDEIEWLYQKQNEAYGEQASEVRLLYGFDLFGSDEEEYAIYQQVAEGLKGDPEFHGMIECRAEARDGFFVMYGGLFFLGIFLGILFIMATILIIYYKQISEGYDDKERYAIMQKVGLSHAEVKRSIHSQILTVFFLPLLAAGVHMVFAFPLVSKILALLSMTNTTLYILCTAGCFLAFAFGYGVIYALTAKVYYRIVSA